MEEHAFSKRYARESRSSQDSHPHAVSAISGPHARPAEVAVVPAVSSESATSLAGPRQSDAPQHAHVVVARRAAARRQPRSYVVVSGSRTTSRSSKMILLVGSFRGASRRHSATFDGRSRRGSTWRRKSGMNGWRGLPAVADCRRTCREYGGSLILHRHDTPGLPCRSSDRLARPRRRCRLGPGRGRGPPARFRCRRRAGRPSRRRRWTPARPWVGRRRRRRRVQDAVEAFRPFSPVLRIQGVAGLRDGRGRAAVFGARRFHGSSHCFGISAAAWLPIPL